MQAILAIRNVWHHRKHLAPENLFSVADRATADILRARTEQLDAARRFWACTF
jgi:hypothetical protein